ncbi:MAG: LysR family transcriptional regulator [Proteobacteria bacterium]|nr:LysR family transcriptional regulator [Pseudomonadota bacterium]
MQRLPTVRQLQYLSALRKFNHFGNAAKNCFVSQSAFSTAIKELENQLDISLVDRTNRSVVFTPAGKIIESQARRALSSIEELVDLAKSVSEPFSGIMRVGIIPTIAPYLLPRLLPALKTFYPNLRLFIREGQSQSIYEQLILGELDLVVYAQPYSMPHVESTALSEDRFHFAYNRETGRDLQLKNNGDIDFNALDAESLLLLEDGHCLREHALASCNLKDKNHVSQFSANTLQTLVQMVNSDLGVTILPDMAMDYLALDKTSIKTQALAKKYHRTIALAWREGSSRDEEFNSIADTMRQAIN